MTSNQMDVGCSNEVKKVFRGSEFGRKPTLYDRGEVRIETVGRQVLCSTVKRSLSMKWKDGWACASNRSKRRKNFDSHVIE